MSGAAVPEEVLDLWREEHPDVVEYSEMLLRPEEGFGGHGSRRPRHTLEELTASSATAIDLLEPIYVWSYCGVRMDLDGDYLSACQTYLWLASVLGCWCRPLVSHFSQCLNLILKNNPSRCGDAQLIVDYEVRQHLFKMPRGREEPIASSGRRRRGADLAVRGPGQAPVTGSWVATGLEGGGAFSREGRATWICWTNLRKRHQAVPTPLNNRFLLSHPTKHCSAREPFLGGGGGGAGRGGAARGPQTLHAQ